MFKNSTQLQNLQFIRDCIEIHNQATRSIQLAQDLIVQQHSVRRCPRRECLLCQYLVIFKGQAPQRLGK